MVFISRLKKGAGSGGYSCRDRGRVIVSCSGICLVTILNGLLCLG